MRPRPLVLVVEDDPTLRDYYRATFGADRYAVRSCSDGIEALEYLDAEGADLLVLDLDLPRLPGVDVYNELRSHPSLARVPVLVITGLDRVPSLTGATVLRKPCSSEVILDAAERALGAYARRRNG